MRRVYVVRDLVVDLHVRSSSHHPLVRPPLLLLRTLDRLHARLHLRELTHTPVRTRLRPVVCVVQVVRGLEGSEHVFLAEDELGGEDGEDVLEVCATKRARSPNTVLLLTLHRIVVRAALRCVMLAREVHRVVVVDPISLCVRRDSEERENRTQNKIRKQDQKTGSENKREQDTQKSRTNLKSVYQVVSYLLRNEIRFVGHRPCRSSDANGDVFVRGVENGLGWEKVCGEEEEEEEGCGKRC